MATVNDDVARLTRAPIPLLSRPKRAALTGFAKLIDKGWPIAFFRAANGALLVLVGVYFERNVELLAVIAFLTYAILFGIFEYFVSATLEEIREQARVIAQDEAQARLEKISALLRETEVSMETYFAAKHFLTWRIGKTVEVVTSLITDLEGGTLEDASKQSIKKASTINDVLGDLCQTLTAIAAKSLDLTIPNAWFRATYMEVRSQPSGEEMLEYLSWHTRDGAQPRSMSDGIKMAKGYKCAGIAWMRRRTVIEDFEKGGAEWVDNYDGQSENYKSMISVPVLCGSQDSSSDVIGVVTVDTGIKGYFGKKNDRVAEDRAGSIVLPYGRYIAFLTAIDEAITRVRAKLDQENEEGLRGLFGPT